MTMNSERQLEPTVLLSAILIKSAVLCGSPGNEKKSVCARVCVCVCVCVSVPFVSVLSFHCCCIDLRFFMCPVFRIILKSQRNVLQERLKYKIYGVFQVKTCRRGRLIATDS